MIERAAQQISPNARLGRIELAAFDLFARLVDGLMELRALFAVEIVALIVEDEREHHAFGQIRRLVEDQTSVATGQGLNPPNKS